MKEQLFLTNFKNKENKMKKITALAMAALFGAAMLSTPLSADVNKGKKLYSKKLKKSCGFNGAKFAKKHTQAQWEKAKGNMAAEIKKLCPAVKDSAVKSKYLKHYYDFAHKYASDSGNVPAC
jgi:hypothetical protein